MRGRNLWLWPFESLSKLFYRAFAMCNPGQGIIEKKVYICSAVQQHYQSEYLWGMRIWASYEVRYDAKITSLLEEGIFLLAGREGMRLGYGFYEIRLNALSSYCHPVARAYTNTGKDFLKFLCVCWIMHWKDTLGEKRCSLGNGISFLLGKARLRSERSKSRNYINK